MVREGQAVAKGDLIGKSGDKGIATGPHLHWQLNLRSHAIDPGPWMDKRSLAAIE
jgi:murein DD-endopeptidase MepM/ murein hydrolase activator NlpD